MNITSLCDIMLSLLIFFMLVSKAGIDTGADADLALPSATLGLSEEELEEQREVGFLVLNVAPSTIPGNPRVYGKLIGDGTEFEMNVENPQNNREEVREFIEEVKGDREDFEVYLHAAADTHYYDVEPVQRAIGRADTAGVRYAFERPE